MDPFIQGTITGSFGATGLIGIILQAISYLKNKGSEPIIMEKVSLPSGGKAYGKVDLSKRVPKVMSELKEWTLEQNKGDE